MPKQLTILVIAMKTDQVTCGQISSHPTNGGNLPQTQQKIVEQLSQYFVASKVKRAYLFGSFARQEQTPLSDIDLLVEFDDTQSPTLLDIVAVKLDLEELLGRKVDVVQQGTEYEHVAKTLERDKILVHG